MTWWRRVKNLWALSEYRLSSAGEMTTNEPKVLRKDIATKVKKMAKIIPEDQDLFNDIIEDKA